VDESAPPPAPGLEQFDAIYDQEFAYVWKTLGRLGIAPKDLDDAAHDVFLVVYRRWGDYDPTRPLRPWLFGIARRIASSYRRKPREELVDGPEQHVQNGDRLARRDLLWRLLAELDDDRLEVIVLHDLEGHTAPAIASLLDLPLNTVYSRLRLAREDLAGAARRLEARP
jgi:RNA polymerase sigma-70 factor (ECF subfamily)